MPEYRLCKTCQQSFPVTAEFWHKDKTSRDGFSYGCKECAKVRARKHHSEHREHANDTSRKRYKDKNPEYKAYRAAHAEQIAIYKRNWRHDNPELVAKHKRDSDKRHPDSVKSRSIKYRQMWSEHNRANPIGDNLSTKICDVCHSMFPATLEYWHKNSAVKGGLSHHCKKCAIKRSRKWYADNKSEAIKRQMQYKAKHTEQYKSYQKTYRKRHPGQAVVNTVRYRSRKRLLPDSFTITDWNTCKEWWGHKCAYCGSSEPLEMDHFLPMDGPECPGTVVTNMLPACKSCNSSKRNNDPVAWLSSRVPELELHEILSRIAAYFCI